MSKIISHISQVRELEQAMRDQMQMHADVVEAAPGQNAQVRKRLAIEHGAPPVLRSECAEMGLCDLGPQGISARFSPRNPPPGVRYEVSGPWQELRANTERGHADAISMAAYFLLNAIIMEAGDRFEPSLGYITTMDLLAALERDPKLAPIAERCRGAIITACQERKRG